MSHNTASDCLKVTATTLQKNTCVSSGVYLCLCVCLPTMWSCSLREQNGCVSFIICPLRAISLSLLHCLLFHSLSFSTSSIPFTELLGGGEERAGQKREEEERSCRTGEIVLIKETAAPCERSLVGQRLNRLRQRGTRSWCCDWRTRLI